jgi:hypothetical protein
VSSRTSRPKNGVLATEEGSIYASSSKASQWLLCLSERSTRRVEKRPYLQGAALQLFLCAVESCLRTHSPGASAAARLGAVAFIHRFGSNLNAHLHFHCVVVDGVFDAAAGGLIFHAACGLDATAIADVQAGVRRRLLRGFARRGLLPGDDAQAMGQWEHGSGFSVDASVRIAAADRAGRERLLRLLRPATVRPGAAARARSRAPALREHRAGSGRKRPADPVTPLQLLDRLAALVPPPRVHRHRYFGVLTPNSPLRCPRCGAEMRIIAFITDGPTVRDILAHCGEPTAPPRIAPARGPPLWNLPEAGPGGFDPHAQPAPAYQFDQRITW